MFIRQSKYLLNRGHQDSALDNINKALLKYPDSNNLLTTRSFCYLQQELWQEALDDAEEVLRDDPDDIQAIFCKAESLFSLCQFENSLCTFYKGKVCSNTNMLKCKKENLEIVVVRLCQLRKISLKLASKSVKSC